MRLTLQVPDGLTLRDAEGKSYPGGETFEVPRTQFWIRRIADGSVTQVEAKPAKAPKSPRPKK